MATNNSTNLVAAAGSLTGATLASGVTASSLTTVGTLSVLAVTGTQTNTSASAAAFVCGRLGATTPAFTVDASVANQASGISIQGQASGQGAYLTSTGGTNEGLVLQSKGTGNVYVNSQAISMLAIGLSGRVQAQNATISITPAARSSTSTAYFLYTGATSSTLSTTANAPQVDYNMAFTQTHAAGTIALNSDFRISGATQAFASSSTMTVGATLSVTGAPIAGSNATITSSATFHSAGAAVTSGVTNSYGLLLTANTGAATADYIASLNGTAGEVMRINTTGQIVLLNTVTTGGTTGNQTINKPSGTVNIAAAGTTVTVTNSLCATTSIIQAVLRTADTTATGIKCVVPSSGSFAITLNAGATAEVSIGWQIIN